MKLQVKPSDPLIVTRWLDVAYILLWFVYGLWGVFSVIVGLPTLNMLTPDWYQTVWSGFIGILSLTACVLASLVFFHTPWFKQISKKRAEFATVCALLAFVVIYPVLLVVRAADGDLSRVGPSAVLAISYLIFPVLRLYFLRGRIKLLKQVTPVAT